MRLGLTALGLVVLLSVASAALVLAVMGASASRSAGIMRSTGMMGPGGMMGSSSMMGTDGTANAGMFIGAAASQPWLTLIAAVFIMLGAVMLLLWAMRTGIREVRRPVLEAEQPLLLLQRRYARGDIGSDEYARVRADLLRDGGQA